MQPKAFLKTLNFLHLSLVLGLILFTVIAYMQNSEITAQPDSSNPFLYAVPIIAIIGYFGSQFLSKKMLSKITSNLSLEEKLKKYKSASHVKFMIIELPAIFALFAFYTTSNALPLVIAVSLIAYLFSQKPSLNKIKTDLNLSKEEIKALES
ncbi:hypothetical protein [uncultured Maribacter sp.]|uniref:hypothetical protein n=1 Tax=uncultured Maribacter sp. TaxID=431308 RepID=UPI002624F059|nr:hypothetical protein [uncultured Maribacter sp.]